MLIVVATIRVKADKAATYEAILRDIMPKVRAVEPDTIFYNVGKSRTEPNTYRVVEAFKDDAAMEHHRQSKFVRDMHADMAACFDGEILIQMHDTI